MSNHKEIPEWFNEARFGMFIHWGLYAILGRGVWAMDEEKIPQEEYGKLADEFNPVRFDADEWVRVAEAAGMRYMVLTTRHHDGFCLFDSQVSDFTAVKTRTHRDFVAEYVGACRRRGMRIGFYYSLLDWRFPGYFNREEYPDSFEAMVGQAHEQVRELMTNYGKIDYLFYDGEWIPGVEYHRTLTEYAESAAIAELWHSQQLNAMVRELQPEIIINNRSGLGEDVDTPEQYVVISQPGRCWESNMTIGDKWGYVKYDPNLKSTTQLIQYLVFCASGGGNYLLNVGPQPDGAIQEEFVQRLTEMGQWMKINGESIYGSERMPKFFGRNSIGKVTAKGKEVYFHIFRWAGEEAAMTGVKNKVRGGAVLKTGQEVTVAQDRGRVVIKGLPEHPPDPHDSVIALELDSKPEIFSYEGMPL